MDTFNILAGSASIIALIIAIFTIPKIIKKMTINNKSKKSHNSQSLNIDGDNDGNITQVIGDKNDVR